MSNFENLIIPSIESTDLEGSSLIKVEGYDDVIDMAFFAAICYLLEYHRMRAAG